MDVMESGQLGKYRLRRLIERGAVGAVYESWDPDLARRVTIKVLPFDEFRGEREEIYALLLGEVQAAERLHHPNIVSVFGSGKTRNAAYLVQDFVEAVTLSQALAAREPLLLAETAQIIESILNGLDYSHGRGVVHGDLTPDRILLAGNDLVRITGFGLAHLSHQGRAPRDQAAVNSAYLAPEQVLGEAPSKQSDIYAAAALLYAMLTGRPPFEGSPDAIVHQVINAVPLQPSRVVTTVPPSLDPVVAKALAKRPAERHASTREFASELRRVFACLDLTTAPPVQRATAQTEPAAPKRDAGVLPGGEPDSPAKAEALPRPDRVADEPESRRPPWRHAAPIAAGVLLLGGLWFALSGPSVRDVRSQAEPTVASSDGEHEVTSGSQPAQKETAPSDTAAAAPLAAPPLAVPSEPKPGASSLPPADTGPQSREAQSREAQSREAQLTTLLRSTVATTPCSLIAASDAADGGVILSGVTALGEASAIEAQANARRTLSAVLMQKPVTWEVSRVDGPYCAPLAALAAAVGQDRDAARLAVMSATAGWDATSTTPLDVLVTTPDYPALLEVDVFTADGSVLHRSMAVANGAAPYPPGERVRLVAVVDRGGAADHAGPKPGLVTVIAASAPLFVERRPAREAAADYLKDLTASLAQARSRGERVTAGALSLDAGS
jgi:serine/threonine protein kinase